MSSVVEKALGDTIAGFEAAAWDQNDFRDAARRAASEAARRGDISRGNIGFLVDRIVMEYERRQSVMAIQDAVFRAAAKAAQAEVEVPDMILGTPAEPAYRKTHVCPGKLLLGQTAEMAAWRASAVVAEDVIRDAEKADCTAIDAAIAELHTAENGELISRSVENRGWYSGDDGDIVCRDVAWTSRENRWRWSNAGKKAVAAERQRITETGARSQAQWADAITAEWTNRYSRSWRASEAAEKAASEATAMAGIEELKKLVPVADDVRIEKTGSDPFNPCHLGICLEGRIFVCQLSDVEHIDVAGKIDAARAVLAARKKEEADRKAEKKAKHDAALEKLRGEKSRIVALLESVVGEKLDVDRFQLVDHPRGNSISCSRALGKRREFIRFDGRRFFEIKNGYQRRTMDDFRRIHNEK